MSQYPEMWPDLASHVTFSAPIRLYPSLQRALHVDPYELSQFPLINPFRGGIRVGHFNTTLKQKQKKQQNKQTNKKQPRHLNTVSTKWLKMNQLFNLTLDGDEELAGFIISCLIDGVVRDKMSPSVKYVLPTTLSKGWDNTRVVSGDNCWPGYCCKVLSSVCESFDVIRASYTEGGTLNIWEKKPFWKLFYETKTTTKCNSLYDKEAITATVYKSSNIIITSQRINFTFNPLTAE